MNARKEINRLMAYSKNSIKCPRCMHSILTSKSKEICRWCGCYVYKDKKEEFKYILGGMLK